MLRKIALALTALATAGAAAALAGTTPASASSAAGHIMIGGRQVNPGGPYIGNQVPGVSAAALTQPTTISLNWSGYADVPSASGQRFASASGTFTQPAITCTGVSPQYTSNWVGLDGFVTQTVEQDGTFAYCGGKLHTTPQYYAWYEMYPAASVDVFRVSPGDLMRASVTATPGGEFTAEISDLTSGRSRTHRAYCSPSTCQAGSAEWIVERPATCNSAGTKCYLTELADFSTTTMARDRVDGRAAGRFPNWPIDMVDTLSQGFISLDTVGALARGSSYTATWDRAGTTVPITLGQAGS